MNQPDSAEEAIFNAARQFADADKRRAYLDLACGETSDLRHRIERLLGASSVADDFFQRNAASGISSLGGNAGATLHSTTSERPGTIIGRYKLLQKLGEGGCGIVYMAEQEEPVRRRVALKVMKQGKSLVVLNTRDGSLQEWDLTMRQQIRRSQITTPTTELVFSPDARWCFTFTYDGASFLRDLSTDRETAFQPPMRMMTGARFSPDGKLLAVTSHLPCAWLWETGPVKQVAILRGFLQGAHSPCFSPDGQRIAVSSDGKEAIKLWTVEPYHELLTLGGEASVFTDTAFSPDGNTLGTLSKEQGVLHLWRAPSWAEIEKVERSNTNALSE